jgi:transcriptional regulator with XRE-family HTH domain
MTKPGPSGMEQAVGREIRRRRAAKKWSLRRLADEAGLDFGYVGKIERGETTNASIESYVAIARALGTTVSALFSAADATPKARRGAMTRRPAVPNQRPRQPAHQRPSHVLHGDTVPEPKGRA